MANVVGLLAAIIAFLAWGFGDFAIQRSVRAIGAIESLFFIGMFGFVGLLPFVWNDIPLLFHDADAILFLGFTVAITLAYAVVLFKSFGVGKLSIIEPILSFELPITMAFGIVLLRESVNLMQVSLAFLIFIGIMFTVIHREPRHWWQFFKKRRILERGVLLALFGTILAAAVNLSTGVLSQDATPLVAIWGIHTSLAFLCVLWMLYKGTFLASMEQAKRHWRPVLSQSVLDNVAWISYAFAVTRIPISITIAITESYIALSALLGIVFNKEKLQGHQYAGIVITLLAAIFLGFVSG